MLQTELHLTLFVKCKFNLTIAGDGRTMSHAMMKSREAWPPGGWQFIQPEGPLEIMGLSFTKTTDALLAFRLKNPGLVKKHNWTTDFETVANEVDTYNDARCRAHGWLDYVSAESDPTLPFSYSPRSFQLKPKAAVGAGVVKNVKAGVKTLLDWLGHGGRPVDKALAETRASICAGCPKNGKGGFEHYFTVPASQAIKLQLEIKNDLKLTTSYDDRLNVCEACLCPTRLKIWCPMEHILKEMSEETKTKLDPRCWILKESK